MPFNIHDVVLQPGVGNLPWLVLLGITLLVSVLGIIAPVSLNQLANPRCHNKEKLWNECLAGHQLAYVTFYIAIIVAKFHNLQQWQIMLLILFLILSVIFYFIGIKYVADQEKNIKKSHQCEDNSCDVRLPWRLKWRVVGVGAVLAFLSFFAAIAVALSPVVAGK